MAKKVARPQHVEPEDESQDYNEPETAGPEDEDDAPETGDASISKSEAARRALDAGLEGPEEATDFIRKQFGIEMSRQHFSAVKSQLKKKQGGGKAAAKQDTPSRRGRKPKIEPEGGYLAPPPQKKAMGGGEGDLLAAMEAMKPLVDSLGKDQVKRIVDLLG